MIWSYLIHLGTNMWGDPGAVNTIPFFHERPDYFETLPCKKDVWDEVVAFLPKCGVNMLLIDLGEGVQYDSHPELAIPGSWSKAQLRAELDKLRAMGVTPIPKLNFSTCHDAWLGKYRLMRCTETYYKVCRDLIDEVCELFDHPAYFHLGMDEEGLECQKDYAIITIRNENLWFHDLYYLAECCERNNARPWVWSDYYWEHPDVFKRRMPRSILQSNWSYSRLQPKGPDGRYAEVGYRAYVELNELGYDQVMTGSCWNFHGNMEQTMRIALDNNFSREHLAGFMIAPWVFTTELSRYTLLDNAHRLGMVRKWYEEELKRR